MDKKRARSVTRACVAFLLAVLSGWQTCGGAAIVVDHNCTQVSAIADDDIALAASLRVLMRHASVGQGIDWGLDCLAGSRPTNPGCSGFAPGKYDRTNWVLELRGGNWQAKVDDLADQAASRVDEFDVLMMKFCYIDALGDRHPDWEYYRSSIEQLEADYPDKLFVWWTIPLTRDGQPGTDVFNELVRSYCIANNKILFDIADIECHDPNGVKQTNAEGNETICAEYTKEIHAGHLNVEGRVLVASALWHLMASVAREICQPDAIELLSPNGGEIRAVGKVYSISWSSTGAISNVRIEYSADKGVSWTAVDPPNTGNAGSYAWLVPPVDSHECLVRISDAENATVGDVSDDVFTIYTQSVMYVDADATGSNDGSTWTDAYNHLQDALADANSVEKPVHIRVARGIYKPDQGRAITAGDRHAAFELIDGVMLEGGYAGFGEPEPNARDIGEYETILTGDLAGNDLMETDVYSLPTDKSRADNSFHVIIAGRTGGTPILNGFTVAGGHDYGCNAPPCHGPTGYGGGMYNGDGNPLVMNCTFRANSAATYGGGMYNDKGSPMLRGCIFVANYARIAGGGMYCAQGNATIESCSFVRNVAPLKGGGLASQISDCLLVTWCSFIGNRADFAGAISNLGSHLHVANCTFAGNRGNGRDAIGIASFEGRPSIVRANSCIFWDSGREILINPDSMLDIAYCDVRGGQAAVEDPCEGLAWGEGNTSVDPCFANAGHWEDPCDTPNSWSDDIWVDGDYHLKSQAGRWDPSTRTWVVDDVTSPCIDAGDINTAVGSEPFPSGGIINMGAYGGTAEASKSYFAEPVCDTIVAGDINGDCKVDFADFEIMASHWLEKRFVFRLDRGLPPP